MFQSRTLDITHLRNLAFKLFTDGQYLDADLVLAELTNLTVSDRAHIAIRRAQIGMLSDNMALVAEQLDIARGEYGAHVYFVGLQADMAMRKGDLASAAAALRLLGRHARAEHLQGFDGGWRQIRQLSNEPVELEAGQALPLFEVTVNGRKGRFVLDTGTGDCLLDKHFAHSAGVKHGPIDQATFAGGRSGYWHLSRIENLCVGGSRFSEMPAMIAPLRDTFGHAFEDGAVDGIVGSELVRAAGGINIDYQRQQFCLGSPGLQDGEPLWIAGTHYPLTPCRVNEGPASTWFIDSGMSGVDLACSESAARRYGAQALNGDIEAYGGGGQLDARAVLIRYFRHADLIYPELPAAILPDFKLGRELGLRIGGIIGHEWLARHRVQLDYHSMLARIGRS